MRLYDQQQHCEDELKEHKQRVIQSEIKLKEHAEAFKKNYATHEEELSSFAKQLQQVMYWKIKRKNNIFSNIGRSDHVAKSYLWKGVLNQEQSVLKDQISDLNYCLRIVLV